MLFMAGGKVRHLFFVALTGVFSIVMALIPYIETIIYHETDGIGSLLTNWTTMGIVSSFMVVILCIAWYGWIRFKKSVFYWIVFFVSILILALALSSGLRLVLKEYQIMRFIVFLDPSIDPRDSGWNLIQSITAIGSGGFSGKGWLAGTQSHLRFLPMQSTDFIFSVIGEELGLIGTLSVLLLFALLAFAIFRLTRTSSDPFVRISSAGVGCWIVVQAIVNIGAVLGLLPITGVPLPFVSYGGSSLIPTLAAVGMLLCFARNEPGARQSLRRRQTARSLARR
jgi:rod shape determining protein RodA